MDLENEAYSYVLLIPISLLVLIIANDLYKNMYG